MTGGARVPRMIAAAVPLVLVNAVAFTGQLAFLRDHLPWTLAGQVAVALALESVAVFLAFHAHVATLANDSALRLRLAAYGLALVIAAMNYSHYAHHWRPTFPAAAVGLMSAISPWLWSVHTRRASRDRLLAAGLVEPHALRLGSTRWLWHPRRSARVMFYATWHGITDPVDALAASAAATPDLPPELPSRDLAGMGQGETIRAAAREVGWADTAAITGYIRAHGGRVPPAAAISRERYDERKRPPIGGSPPAIPPPSPATLNGRSQLKRPAGSVNPRPDSTGTPPSQGRNGREPTT